MTFKTFPKITKDNLEYPKHLGQAAAIKKKKKNKWFNNILVHAKLRMVMRDKVT